MPKHDLQLNSPILAEKTEDDLAVEDLASEDIKPPSATEVWWTQYLDGGNMLDSLEASNKFVVVFKILDESIALGDKVLIFSTSLITMDALEYFLKRINGWSLGHEYYRLDGSVPPEVRQKWCREFNAEQNIKTKLFLISTRAGCLGLNMVAANRVIILDTSWNPAHDIQSIFRVYRFGQKKDCYIYRLVAMGTMEQKIYERSVTKQAIACRVVDEQQIDRHYNMAELTELYKFDELGSSVVGGVAVGVTDVALLRVARLPALYAVHEHDSLLRGSSEQELPDHERAAAWMQFQQEHAHKQMQNQLTSSFALHIPRITLPEVYPEQTPINTLYSDQSLLQARPEVKLEDPPYSPTDPKGKKNKRKQTLKVNIPIQSDTPLPTNKAAKAVEEDMVRKIMDLLIRHDFQGYQTPQQISALVTNVRKIVAYGHVPKGTFNSQLTESIANVLLGKEATLPSSGTKIPTRGRPRKVEIPIDGASTSQITPKPLMYPEEIPEYVGRRKAAIMAEKNLSSATDSIIDLDADESTQDAWEDDNRDPDYADEIMAVPEIPKQRETLKVTRVKSEPVPQPAVTQNSTHDSINLLSDDDEPSAPEPQKEKTKPAEPPKEVIPLHPSLLSNVNFIKIVAHTYLEGNPMLDDDAANMAAQYSTSKALKEFEATGKPIINGPIYDIAIKVLGIDILMKLHKTNPKIKPKPIEEPVQVKQEAEPSPAPVSSGISRVSSGPARVSAGPARVSAGPARVSAGPARVTAGPARVKAKGISELMVKQEPTTSGKISVVPVEMFKSNERIPPASTAVPRPSVVEREESILPDDDDDVMISDTRPAVANYPATRKKSQPLILNSVISRKDDCLKKAEKHIIKLTAGTKFLINKTKADVEPVETKPRASPRQTPQKVQSKDTNTICLDSDDDEPPPPKPPPPKKKMVALKSTAKPSKAKPVPVSLTSAQGKPVPLPFNATNQGPVPISGPVPVSLTAANQEPVPVSLTAANPAHPIPENVAMNQQYYTQTITYDQIQNQNYFMIPQGVPQGGVKRIVVPGYNPQGQPSMVSTPSGNVIYSGTPGIQFMHAVPQNMMTQQGMVINSVSQMNMMNQQQEMNMVGSNMMPVQNIAPHPPQNNSFKQNAAPNQRSGGKTNTLCRPGDILRITETGQVEILNKVAVADPQQPKQPTIATIETPKKATSSTTQKTEKKKDRSRKVSSSSSSSSDSSRASSPEKDNQLSIFKDIVHIKSVEDILDSSIQKSKHTSQKAAKSKISQPASKTQPPSKTQPSRKASKPTPQAEKTIPKKYPPSNTKSNTSIIQQINKTDSILKKLDNVLGPSTSNKKPASKTVSAKDVRSIMDLVDLDDEDTSKSYKPPVKSKPQTATTSKPSTSKSAASKLVGTSKNIIIGGDGKASLNTSAKREVKVTSIEKIVPQKRPAPTDSSANKKKKSEPMTLKDFDIDDIDDIIELE